MPEHHETIAAPERYIRINITKNSKGYTYETTVSLRWTGSWNHANEIDDLLKVADAQARDEIKRREGTDEELAP